MNQDFKNILSCWHKLEHFTPATLPKGDNVSLLSNKTPWNMPLMPTNKEKTIEYTVYLGVFNSLSVSGFVNDFFSYKDDNENEKNSKICYACLKVDINGYYVPGSLGISTLPWALSQLENEKLNTDDWSNKFEDLQTRLLTDFDYIFNEPEINEEGEVIKNKQSVSYTLLKDIESRIIELCGWSVQPEVSIYVKRDERFINSKSNGSSDILNSFYTKDLEKIITKHHKNTVPEALSKYLKGSLNQKLSRTDLVKTVSALQESLVPGNYPDGCWPSKYTLSLMQQISVNSIFSNLSSKNGKGIFSVNGPPGTGKTTLLRDVIAPILVKKAKELSKIKDPTDVFNKAGKLKVSESFTANIYSPQEPLNHYGIVVASSNNGAVENISKELPLKEEVEPYSNQIAYFRETAEECFGQENWGLISAVLGKKQNRKEFVDKVWYDFKESTVIGLQKELREKKQETNSEWESIVNTFNAKLKEVESEKQKLENYRKDYYTYLEVYQRKELLIRQINELELTYNDIRSTYSDQQTTKEELEARKTELLTELTVLNQNKPGFFIYWFNKRIRKEFKKSLNILLSEYNALKETLLANSIELQKTEHELNKTKATIDSNQKKLETVKKEFERLVTIQAIAQEELGNNYADNSFWAKIESNNSQQACPWYSDTLKRLQSELFILSLKLNETFLFRANSESSKISTTLAAFFEYLKGDSIPSREEVKSMWNTFFMVVPVVSTTFASVQKMFTHLEAEDIPWLFIDEAGQAIPQAATGAVWRSKRVAVVGDPFQIEPVVTISNAITNNISKYFNLNNTQINTELSVQTMADRINPLGSYININEEDIWIGIPLRVHRRCLNPMFDISNRIAYNDTMYQATLAPKKVNVNFETSFINCVGNVEGRHYVEAQAEIVKNILLSEINTSNSLPDIFVITPFSEISYKLNSFLFKPLINEVKKYVPAIDSTAMGDWLKSHVGTVHTFQGKQAEGVILCLGLDERTKGAAGWASKKPNLLNVAITRAKYRFIAIGDERIWLKQRYFKELTSL